MKRFWLPILALIVTFAACQEQQGDQTGTTEETVDPATVEQSIRESADRFEQAMLAGDVAALTAFYADDAIVLPQGAPKTEGSDAIQTSFQDMIAQGGKPTAFSLEPQTIVVAEAGDLAYEVGTFTWTGPGPDGTEMSDTGKYVAIWEATDTGEWKMAVDAWNSDAMPGAPAEGVEETTTTETAPAPAGQ